ncbi:MAG: hypothetical protein LBV43_08020, partial [Prevotella sp.]|nr:hypothetical protein [Prevotella sp.]
MKLIKVLCIVLLFLALVSSCILFEDPVGLYYKSTFLGANSFTVTGSIYDTEGKPKSGNKFIAKIRNYEDEWSIETVIQNSQFSITVDTTDTLGRKLPFDDPEYYAYDTVWEIFSLYYALIPIDEESYLERDKKMYKLDFYLDVYNGNHSNWLTEFTEEKPVHYFSDGIRYVYIPEPINMKKKSFYLKDESGENYYSFDCDFSK